ncbi:hypothetical protein EZJ49_05305 [Bdellovibrio bacteriovorus]|uniref:hypothetical protein n=1 Tax=Bdellovibrio bacteriovorus TaxID=959 RepID=UPI0021D28A2D|nr:hypothetical protein [Bdellovibrio bacteriovorus]UXR65665.1 hypothetical protein EZJ49_05305 [Bdellovibrio bacteriovorus]
MRLFFLFLMIFSSEAYSSYGMNTLSSDYKPQADSVVQVANMPRVRSQDSFGICYAFAASVLYDEANCVAKNISDCASVSDSDKVSPLDMARFSKELPSGVDGRDRFNYEGLSEGGAAALVLQNSINSDANVKESCAPFDQIVAKNSNPAEAQKLELAMWKRFQDSYNAYQKKTKDCVECGLEYATAKAQELKDNFKLKASNKDILKAFAEDTYSKFLDGLLVPGECWRITNGLSLEGSWDLNIYPEHGQKNQKSDYNKMLAKIKEVLQQKRPLSLAFCAQMPLQAKSLKSCTSEAQNSVTGTGHEIVVKGYRRVCNSKNQCRDSLQIQNSWGQSWQNANDDGWVDAKELLDRTFYEPQSLTWLSKAKL